VVLWIYLKIKDKSMLKIVLAFPHNFI
jgi:hypothetical protein